MDAIQVAAPGGPEVLTLTDLPIPEPGPGQVLVRLSAVGVNFVEIYQRGGLFKVPLPLVPGSEGAGVVEAVGSDVTSPAVGDRVVSINLAGSYAQYALAAANRVVPIPEGVSDEQAGAVLLQGMTAHYLLHDCYPVRAGDTVLVHAAAGGLGLLLTQLATSLGARVIGTVSTPEKEKLARATGAAEVIGYEDVAERVRELTGGEGVAAVYDGVGRDTFDASLASLRTRGTLVLYGYASGPPAPLDVNRLQAGGSLSLTRPSLMHFVVEDAELRRHAGDVLGWVTDGTLKVTVGGRYPLAEAARAHADLESRRTTGKLLLIP
ncbi:quinone oxidoreductase family protein [Phytohabitans suffuscus]|uniref:Quinone oxidoreductase n=1 Tax=Phytohabitans suffuscus TaxID=624315 RepID=A0A6F8Z0E6_9ACTN|nr:quinone oxidoreductase [Phytohabitans suffuscus]BCB91658.1 quinone oxidoreductase [Phytohabitans suffuscus]